MGDRTKQLPAGPIRSKYARRHLYQVQDIRTSIEYHAQKTSQLDAQWKIDEVNALRNAYPHAIITTNYDKFFEVVMDEFIPIVGDQVIYNKHFAIGEINKIHGCVSDPASMILTAEDYERFEERSKYLSARLLTYFVEHPLVFFGYSAVDPNIKTILFNIGQILGVKESLIENIFFVDWRSEIKETDQLPLEKIIGTGEGASIRVRNITSDSFTWIFKAFGEKTATHPIRPQVLRTILARAYDLVRSDIPREEVKVDYAALARAAENDGEMAKLFGITLLGDKSSVNARFPYCLSEVAGHLKLKTWYDANILIQKIKEEKGIDIKESDNRYHMKIKNGRKNFNRMYSPEAIILLEKVMNGQDYEIRLHD